jgi:hypothetical protein
MAAIRANRQILALRFLFVLLILVTYRAAGADSSFKIPPYVQNVETTSATILWKPMGKLTGQVRYGITTEYEAFVDGHIQYVVENGNPQSNKGSILCAQLVDLEPDRAYHYRVILPSSVSEDRTFRTAPADVDTAFTFLAYGDSRSNPQTHARVISAATAIHNPAFVLHTGDVVPTSGDGEPAWRRQFFEPTDLLLRKTWFLVTRGNHDGDNHLLSLYFEAGGGQVKDYYSFDWGPVHMTTINTNKDYRPGSEQHQFLERDLTSTHRPFKVFFGHHPTYSSGFHGSTLAMQRFLQPLFDKNGVKLVFAGHEHDYERTIVNGITYVVSGGGGAPLYGQENLGKNPDSLVFKKAHNFVKVDVTRNAMTLTAWAVESNGFVTLADQAVITPHTQPHSHNASPNKAVAALTTD